jgi:NADPH2:quinone reductase
MKAWLIDNIGGGIDQLRLAETPDPKPGPGEVLLDVRYAALNPADRYLAEGQYPAKPPLPHILGRDGAGVVRETGPGVSTIRPGESYAILRSGEVGITRPGTFAQRVVAPADSLIPIPPGWSIQQASCASLVYLTAYQALTQWGDLPPAVVLITGASGGVGVASIHLAAAMGHTIVALSRGAAKREQLKQLGAAAAFDPNDPQWRRQLKEFLSVNLKGRRIDLAIDNIGGELFSQVIDTLGEWGKVSVVGRLAGPVPQFNTASLFFRRIRIGGVAVGTYTTPESRAAWQQILALMERRSARPLVDRIFPFDQLPAAFVRLAEGPMGKVLLSVD